LARQRGGAGLPLAAGLSKLLEMLGLRDLARLVLRGLHHRGRWPAAPKEQSMQACQQNLFTRDDTFFGVCAGLGEDFGFNPQYLRIVLGVSVLVNPTAVLSFYVVAGILVLLSRLNAPNPRQRAAEEPVIAAPTVAEPVQAIELEPEPLAVAA
jgi:phage shock protein PspC (stress-responsive transcriptional regulator)